MKVKASSVLAQTILAFLVLTILAWQIPAFAVDTSPQVTVGAEAGTVAVDSSFIVRNVSATNGLLNYVIVANNFVGSIVVPTNSGAISGNTAVAGTLGTTDPWANFSN